MRRAVALLIVGAALAPSTALAARVLSDSTAYNMAFAQAIKDKNAEYAKVGGTWLAPEVSCRRKASTWMVCHNTIGQSATSPAHVVCKRTVDVRLRSGRPAPVLTKRPMTCVG